MKIAICDSWSLKWGRNQKAPSMSHTSVLASIFLHCFKFHRSAHLQLHAELPPFPSLTQLLAYICETESRTLKLGLRIQKMLPRVCNCLHQEDQHAIPVPRISYLWTVGELPSYLIRTVHPNLPECRKCTEKEKKSQGKKAGKVPLCKGSLLVTCILWAVLCVRALPWKGSQALRECFWQVWIGWGA